MNLERHAREARIPSPELPGSGSMGLSRSHAALSAFVPPGPVGSPSDDLATVGFLLWSVKRPDADVFDEKNWHWRGGTLCLLRPGHWSKSLWDSSISPPLASSARVSIFLNVQRMRREMACYPSRNPLERSWLTRTGMARAGHSGTFGRFPLGAGLGIRLRRAYGGQAGAVRSLASAGRRRG
jgi:hypothetical protein